MEKFGFFNDIEGDRVYYAEDIARHLKKYFTNGIFNNELKVIANNDMTITIQEGDANIEGYRYTNTGDLIKAIDIADGTLSRIDNVVLRLDLTNRLISVQIIKGTFADNPVAPDLVRTSTTYDLRIAKINIPAGTTEITQDLIVDTRFITTDCGNVICAVQTPDTEQLFIQLQTLGEKTISDIQENFDDWLQKEKQKFNHDELVNMFNDLQNLQTNTQTTIDEIINSKINYYKKYTSDYITLNENENIIPINIDAYNESCMLFVYINGFLKSESDYTIFDNNIILDNGLSEIGTKISIICLKSIIANEDTYELLKGEPGEDGADNLMYDEETNLLQLLQKNNPIGNPVKIISCSDKENIITKASGIGNLKLKNHKKSIIYKKNGKCEQVGTPTPDNPSEIKAVKGVINVCDNEWELGNIRNGNNYDATDLKRSKNFIEVEPNTDYVFGINDKPNKIIVVYYDSNKNWIDSDNNIIGFPCTNGFFTTPSNCYYIRFRCYANDFNLIRKETTQLEKGTILHKHVPRGSWLRIDSTGRNLIDVDEYTTNSSGTTIHYLDKMPDLKLNSKYMLSGKCSDGTSLTGNAALVIVRNGIQILNWAVTDNPKTLTQNILDATDIYIFTNSNLAGKTISEFQLEENIEKTEYDPYKNSYSLIDMNKPTLFYKDKVINGIGLNGNGTTYSQSTRSILDYTEIKPNSYYTIKKINWNIIDFYDSEKNFISYLISNSNNIKTFTTPANTKYIRISFDNTIDYLNASIYEGIEPYYELCSIDDVKDELNNNKINKKFRKIIIQDSDITNYNTTSFSNLNYLYISKRIDDKNYNNYDGLGKIKTSFAEPYDIYSYNDIKMLNKIGLKGGALVYLVGFSKDVTEEQAREMIIGQTIYYELAEPEEIILPEYEMDILDGDSTLTDNCDIKSEMELEYSSIDTEILKKLFSDVATDINQDITTNGIPVKCGYKVDDKDVYVARYSILLGETGTYSKNLDFSLENVNIIDIKAHTINNEGKLIIIPNESITGSDIQFQLGIDNIIKIVTTNESYNDNYAYITINFTYENEVLNNV